MTRSCTPWAHVDLPNGTYWASITKRSMIVSTSIMLGFIVPTIIVDEYVVVTKVPYETLGCWTGAVKSAKFGERAIGNT